MLDRDFWTEVLQTIKGQKLRSLMTAFLRLPTQCDTILHISNNWIYPISLRIVFA